jgi:hypothetical protein
VRRVAERELVQERRIELADEIGLPGHEHVHQTMGRLEAAHAFEQGAQERLALPVHARERRHVQRTVVLEIDSRQVGEVG